MRQRPLDSSLMVTTKHVPSPLILSSIAQDCANHASIRFNPQAGVVFVTVAPAVNDEFALLVKMPFIHANIASLASEPREVGKCCIATQFGRKFRTQEQSKVDAYKIELLGAT